MEKKAGPSMRPRHEQDREHEQHHHRDERITISLDDDSQAFIEKLVGTRKLLTDIMKAIKEIRKEMPTQTDIDTITQQLEDVKTQVGKIGTDLADFIADNPSVTLDALRAKATEVAAALQNVDDLLPEATP